MIQSCSTWCGRTYQHYKPSRKGRRPIAVEVILRMTVLRRRKKWTYRQAEQEVRDSPVPALREHQRLFHHAPHVLAGDRAFFSPDNQRFARQVGVKQFAIPQTGCLTKRQRQREKQPWFKQGQRFRNGIEGRISVIRRTVQLAHCPNHGLDGFERWIGWGIIVANLVVIARKLHSQRHGSKRQAKRIFQLVVVQP